MVRRYLLPFSRLSVNSGNDFLHCLLDVDPSVYFCFSYPCLWNHIHKNFADIVMRVTPCFHLGYFWFQISTFKPLIQLELLFLGSVKRVVQLYSFTCGCPVFQRPVFAETVLSAWHAWSWSFVLNWFPVCCEFISGISTLIHQSMCLFLLWYHYCSFVIYFEIREHDTSSFFSFFLILFCLTRLFCGSIQVLELF